MDTLALLSNLSQLILSTEEMVYEHVYLLTTALQQYTDKYMTEYSNSYTKSNNAWMPKQKYKNTWVYLNYEITTRVQEHIMNILMKLWANYDINNYYKTYSVCIVLTTSLHVYTYNTRFSYHFLGVFVVYVILYYSIKNVKSKKFILLHSTWNSRKTEFLRSAL